MQVLSVVGARPQFVKISPVDQALKEAGHSHFIVHTGQHYEASMSDVFFDELAIPSPNINMAVGSSSHGQQTAEMLTGLETIINEVSPSTVIVYGDTNSTLAATLAAVKLHTPVVHVEAGLRSFNRVMPEEVNRVLTDHASDLLLAPTEIAMKNLSVEGLQKRSRFVGDVMLDVFEKVKSSILDLQTPSEMLERDDDFVLATIHRQENTSDKNRLRSIIDALAHIPAPVTLAVHPRLRDIAEKEGINLTTGSIHCTEPLGYVDLIATLLKARAVVTDSGGLQKEAFFAETPCVTVRSETEWLETLSDGWNVLAEPADIVSAIGRPKPLRRDLEPFGMGNAGKAVVAAIESGFLV